MSNEYQTTKQRKEKKKNPTWIKVQQWNFSSHYITTTKAAMQLLLNPSGID